MILEMRSLHFSDNRGGNNFRSDSIARNQRNLFDHKMPDASFRWQSRAI